MKTAPIQIAAVVAGAMLASLQGCDSVNQAVVQAKSSVESALAPASSASNSVRTASSRTLVASDVAGLFKRYPLGSPQARGDFPRVAVTITSASPSIARRGKTTADQCISFQLRVWSDAKTSRLVDGLQMCGTDTSFDVPFRSLMNWPYFFAPRDTTEAVRTDGPRRPKTNFPTDAVVLDSWFREGSPGIYFIGSILYQLGYDWSQPAENRLWFVSVPSRGATL